MNKNVDNLLSLQFAEASRMIDEAAQATEIGDLAKASNRLAEALSSALLEATETIAGLQARIGELENDPASQKT